MNELVPFGKYRGQPAQILQHDLPYVLDKIDSKSRWIDDLFGDNLLGDMLHAAIRKPQHNRLQDLFVLDEEFRRQVFYAFVQQNCDDAIRDLQEAAHSSADTIADAWMHRHLSVGGAEPESTDGTDISFRGSLVFMLGASLRCRKRAPVLPPV